MVFHQTAGKVSKKTTSTYQIGP